MTKKLGIYVAIAAAWGLAYAAKDYFGISDIWMGLIVITVIAVLISFNFEDRLRAIEARVDRRDYSGTLAQLQGVRHEPQHKQPESLAAGGADKSLIGPEDEVLFDDFKWFAVALNGETSDPWVIEELNDTDIPRRSSSACGRKYLVWYNACQVGRLQVTKGFGRRQYQDMANDKRSARAELNLNYLSFIRYEHAHSLLSQLVLLVGPLNVDNRGVSRDRAAAIAAGALGGHLWEAIRNPGSNPSFGFTVDGPYDLHWEQIVHWKKHDFDPMAEWG